MGLIGAARKGRRREREMLSNNLNFSWRCVALNLWDITLARLGNKCFRSLLMCKLRANRQLWFNSLVILNIFYYGYFPTDLSRMYGDRRRSLD